MGLQIGKDQWASSLQEQNGALCERVRRLEEALRSCGCQVGAFTCEEMDRPQERWCTRCKVLAKVGE